MLGLAYLAQNVVNFVKIYIFWRNIYQSELTKLRNGIELFVLCFKCQNIIWGHVHIDWCTYIYWGGGERCSFPKSSWRMATKTVCIFSIYDVFTLKCLAQPYICLTPHQMADTYPGKKCSIDTIFFQYRLSQLLKYWKPNRSYYNTLRRNVPGTYIMTQMYDDQPNSYRKKYIPCVSLFCLLFW